MSKTNHFNTYLKEVQNIYLSGEATEPSYYPSFKNFLEECAKYNKKSVEVIPNPKRTEGGLPDFLLKTNGKIIGYIEAKDIVITNLDKISETDQLKRYRRCYPNLILTNFLEFVTFRDGIRKKRVRICETESLIRGYHVKPKNIEKLNEILNIFFSHSTPTIYKAKQLATELAKRTLSLNNAILEELNDGNEDLLGIFNAFRAELIKSLTKEKFSDLYSQTIIYGLFFARIEAKDKLFTRKTAYSFIPSTMPLLQNMFYIITGPNLPKSLDLILDDVVTLLINTNLSSILKDFHTKIWTEDPVVHFYETFLGEYNPKEKQRRGVYYTPAPVVSYIISSIHEILKKEFSKKDGLADKDVTLLDPAAGTLTFPTTAIRLLHNEFKRNNKQGIFNNLVKHHILKHFFALELMVAPYAIGHFKANMVLEDLGYVLSGAERFQFYLTNTLEMKEPRQVTFIPALAREGKKAQEVKERIPILVVCGNPPYSISSDNKSEFIEKLIDDYKKDVRTEKNIHPLSDDYIKFIRFAQWKIEQLGHGIVGYITNNTYLSGLVHRGIRKTLLEVFDEIYILNLHGNSIICEKTPDGGKDENVFDIRVGVTISLLVKKRKSKDGLAKVNYCDVWGLAEEKYEYLTKNNVNSTKWIALEPKEPYFFFIPKEFLEEETYKRFWSIFDIFEKNKIGVCTKRDKFITAFEANTLKTRIKTLLNKNLTKKDVTRLYGLDDTYEWNLERALKTLRRKGFSDKLLIHYSYRPFDIRYIYYEDALIARSVKEVMKHLQRENLGLVLGRAGQNVKYPDWDLVFVTELTTDLNLFYRGGATVFPLYIYNKTKNRNISKKFIETLEKNYDESVKPDEIIYYIYGILHSNIFRKKYDEFLMIAFPRIPFTTNFKLFKKIVELGKKLCEIHLLKSPILNREHSTYPMKGDDVVRKVKYDEKLNRIYINKNQYFGNVPPDVWQYHIGGYQVLYKWLKDRKNRKLGYADQTTYLKVISAIRNTILVQDEIDEKYPGVEEDLIETVDLKKTEKDLLTYLLR